MWYGMHMYKHMAIDAGDHDKPSWSEEHIPTLLSTGRGIRRRFNAIPPLPIPLATLLLAILGILGSLLILWFLAAALNLGVSHS
jgi:hypothetical protein